MSERKVLQKYYPPDFDPSAIEKRRKGPKQTGPKIQPVRLMAPFSMKCTSCGEYIYKGRKFNARKETTEEKYYAISIFRFYIRCTRCSAEITFKTDPKNMDYTCERGARRNFEPWREAKLAEETEEERLDRLEREEGERDKMVELERKTNDAQMEMRIADALDDVRMRNAMRERGVGWRGDSGGCDGREGKGTRDDEAERVEREIEEQARRAFQSATGERVRRLDGDIELDDSTPITASSSSASSSPFSSARSSLNDNSTTHPSDPADPSDKAAMPPPPPPSTTTFTTTTTAFQRKPKTKKDFASSLGIKKPIVPPAAVSATATPDDGAEAEAHRDPSADRNPALAGAHVANGSVPPPKKEAGGGGGVGVGIGLVGYGSESSDED
ncbi:hypothetical protein BTJ68_09387 [Hortaea werneckii EXF-2000]|uniref:Splicing factor YJU2 n=1 Tax=Hortaea werneckii EXF-2000 TaxID=1157616 RepID=A0A1Z5T388_HORWE|nr:hypothetical protein BTJ68_09387 [Hortaea werneckii EXF-2000]